MPVSNSIEITPLIVQSITFVGVLIGIYLTTKYKKKEIDRLTRSYNLEEKKFGQDQFIRLLNLSMSENDESKQQLIAKLSDLIVFIENELPVNIYGDTVDDEWLEIITPIIFRNANEISKRIDFIIVNYSYIYLNIIDDLKRIKDIINEENMYVTNEIASSAVPEEELSEAQKIDFILEFAENIYKIYYKLCDCHENAIEAYNLHRKMMNDYIEKYLKSIL